MQVRFKMLHNEAVIPVQTIGNAGMDMTAISIEETEDYIEYDTGIAVEIPEGYVGYIFPRSSNSKKDLLLCNSVGVVDSSYRGSIRFRYKKVGHKYLFIDPRDINQKFYEVGDRVGQLIIMPYPKIESVNVGSEELSSTDRGVDGFGSTGK